MITESMMSKVCVNIAKEKDEWLNFWLRKLLPPVYFRYKVHPELFQNWLRKKQIYLASKVDEPNVTVLMQGQTPIAKFQIII